MHIGHRPAQQPNPTNFSDKPSAIDYSVETPARNLRAAFKLEDNSVHPLYFSGSEKTSDIVDFIHQKWAPANSQVLILAKNHPIYWDLAKYHQAREDSKDSNFTENTLYVKTTGDFIKNNHLECFRIVFVDAQDSSRRVYRASEPQTTAGNVTNFIDYSINSHDRPIRLSFLISQETTQLHFSGEEKMSDVENFIRQRWNVAAETEVILMAGPYQIFADPEKCKKAKSACKRAHLAESMLHVKTTGEFGKIAVNQAFTRVSFDPTPHKS